MAEFKGEEFKFPDEVENEPETKFEIEIEDDIPPEDKEKTPLPKNIVDEIDEDDLESYSQEAKTTSFPDEKTG